MLSDNIIHWKYKNNMISVGEQIPYNKCAYRTDRDTRNYPCDCEKKIFNLYHDVYNSNRIKVCRNYFAELVQMYKEQYPYDLFSVVSRAKLRIIDDLFGCMILCFTPPDFWFQKAKCKKNFILHVAPCIHTATLKLLI